MTTDHPTAPSPLDAARLQQIRERAYSKHPNETGTVEEIGQAFRWQLDLMRNARADLCYLLAENERLEAALSAAIVRAEGAEAALKPFADDYHWHLDWNRKHPQEIPQTYSEWLERKDPVSIASAVRHVYDLLYPQANGDGA